MYRLMPLIATTYQQAINTLPPTADVDQALAKQMRVNKEPMNKQEDKVATVNADELNAHYDFDYGKAKSNRFAARLSQEQVMVVLDPDVAAIFPTAEAVNDALRVLATAVQNLPNATPKRRRKQPKVATVPSVQ
jgi:hypothetical protein